MYFKTLSVKMAPYFTTNVYPCPICNKEISPGEKYTFIDPYMDDNKTYVAGSYCCNNEECIQMRIFQMME